MISHKMLNYKTECMLSPLKDTTEETLQQEGAQEASAELCPHVMEQAVRDKRCWVCMLEASIFKRKSQRLKIPITEEIKEKLYNAFKGN